MLTQEELLARAKQPSEDALRLHLAYRGKIQVVPKCPVRSFEDFAIWVPRMDEWEIYPRIAAATGLQAQTEGVAKLNKSYDELLDQATKTIRDARDARHTLMRDSVFISIPFSIVTEVSFAFTPGSVLSKARFTLPTRVVLH